MSFVAISSTDNKICLSSSYFVVMIRNVLSGKSYYTIQPDPQSPSLCWIVLCITRFVSSPLLCGGDPEFMYDHILRLDTRGSNLLTSSVLSLVPVGKSASSTHLQYVSSSVSPVCSTTSTTSKLPVSVVKYLIPCGESFLLRYLSCLLLYLF